MSMILNHLDSIEGWFQRTDLPIAYILEHLQKEFAALAQILHAHEADRLRPSGRDLGLGLNPSLRELVERIDALTNEVHNDLRSFDVRVRSLENKSNR